MKTSESNVSYRNDLPPNQLRQGERTCTRKSHGLIRFLAISLALLPTFVSAQIVSNLGEVLSTIFNVSNTFVISNAFTTGSNVGGYTLDSATVNLFNISGSPGDLVVGIHSASGSDPGGLLEDLAGADPGAGGNHTFTSTGLTLDADTTYFIQLSSPSSVPGNSYLWSFTSSDNETSSDGWAIADVGRISNDSGGTWSNAGGSSSGRFSIQATPVPEPHEYAMFVGLGLVVFVGARRRLVSKALV